MNKQALVGMLASRLGVSKAKAGEAVDALFSPGGIIAGELKRGGRVQITGFGNFEVRKRAARQGLHPGTGKAISIKASSAPTFRPSKALKEVLNRKR